MFLFYFLNSLHLLNIHFQGVHNYKIKSKKNEKIITLFFECSNGKKSLCLNIYFIMLLISHFDMMN